MVRFQGVVCVCVCVFCPCVNIICIYLLIYSMVQSPSWEANWFVASQEIPCIFMEPEGSLPHSLASATCPCPGPAKYYLYLLILIFTISGEEILFVCSLQQEQTEIWFTDVRVWNIFL